MGPDTFMHRTYKIVNSVDSMVYYGSTKLSLAERMGCHCYEARKGNPKRLSEHMRLIGIDQFSIVLVQDGYSSKLEARQGEQACIDAHENKDELLNAMLAYSWNPYCTRDREKLLAKKKRYYDKKMQEPEYVAHHRERNRLRMQKKRAILREVRAIMSIQI